MIGLRFDVQEHPAASKVVNSIMAALSKPEKGRFVSSILRTARPVEVRTRGGLHVGTGTTYNVDHQRLCAVIRRTMLGLYFHEMGKRMPDAHEPRVWAVSGFATPTAEQVTKIRELVAVATSGRCRIFGDNVFAYFFQTLTGIPDTTLWAFLVYHQVPFIGFTGPPVNETGSVGAQRKH